MKDGFYFDQVVGNCSTENIGEFYLTGSVKISPIHRMLNNYLLDDLSGRLPHKIGINHKDQKR